MTMEQKVIRAKVGMLEIAKQLGNESEGIKTEISGNKEIPAQSSLRTEAATAGWSRGGPGALGGQPPGTPGTSVRPLRSCVLQLRG